MVKSLTTLQGITLGAALLTAVLYAAWETASEGPRISLADYLCTLQQTENIIDDRAVLDQSIAVNRDIYDRLLEGQLSLAEAAAALREEIESRPAHLQPPIYLHERNVPPPERYMLRLLHRMEFQLADDPRRGEVLTRLRGEWQAYCAARVRAVPTDAPDRPPLVAQ
jgi:hypothetical protein